MSFMFHKSSTPSSAGNCIRHEQDQTDSLHPISPSSESATDLLGFSLPVEEHSCLLQLVLWWRVV